MSPISHDQKRRLRDQNRARLARDLISESPVWESRPVLLEIASNDYCNLRCVMCPQGYDMPHHRMRPNDLMRICRELFPYAEAVTPSAGSEPLIGNFDLVVNQCREHRVEINLITNATLLTPDKFRSCADCVGRVQISFDSPDKEVFERIRVRGDFDAITKNIREVNATPERADIEMMMNFVLLRDNVEDVPRMVYMAADLGMDSLVILKHIQQVPGAEQFDPAVTFETDEIEAYLGEAQEAARINRINLHIHIEPPRYFFNNPKEFRKQHTSHLIQFMHDNRSDFCFNAASYLKVTPTGDVFPCCVSPPDLNMGNIFQDDFADIWNGKKYQELRMEMFSGNWRQSCATCPYLAMVNLAPPEVVT